MYLPNCQTNLVIALYTLSLLLCKFINTTAYPLGRFNKKSPNVYKSCQNDFTRKIKVFEVFTKNESNLGKIIFVTGFEKLPKEYEIAQSGRTDLP